MTPPAPIEKAQELRIRLQEFEAEPLDAESLRPQIEQRVCEMRAALEGAPDERRAALKAFLGGDRLRVLPDAERGFRVEGLLRVRLKAEPARNQKGAPGRSYGW